MSAPRFAPALSGEHSWVPDGPPLDPALALDQWHQLAALVAEHIAPVEELPAEPWAPAMTFTRDLALRVDDIVVPFMAHGRRGPFEAPLAHRHLELLGIDLTAAPEPIRFDGGNVLADFHGRLLIGAATEPDEKFIASVRWLEDATKRTAFKVPLSGHRFPHVDMAMCDLNGRAWLAYPRALPGFDLTDPGWKTIFHGSPVITVADADGENLACNLIVHGDVAIGPEISTDLRSQINAHGIDYVATPMTELLKAGGSAHCLTLELP